MTNLNHYLVLISIIISSGLLGGFGNYLILPNEKDRSAEKNAENSLDKNLLTRSIVLGVIASFMVPLFLKTISSNLLDKPTATKPDELIFNASYFVLAGFCLLAAVLSKQFIESLYDKVMKAQADAAKAVNKAEEADKKVKNVEASLTEIDNEDVANINDPAAGEAAGLPIAHHIPTLEERILSSIGDSKYIWRSGSGIAKNLEMKKTEIMEALQTLVDQGKVEKKINAEGQLRYKLKI
jgi:hypothetical protein